jgi:hypothetical protein
MKTQINTIKSSDCQFSYVSTQIKCQCEARSDCGVQGGGWIKMGEEHGDDFHGIQALFLFGGSLGLECSCYMNKCFTFCLDWKPSCTMDGVPWMVVREIARECFVSIVPYR